LGLVAGEEPEGLHVEDKAGRRSFDPRLRGLLGGKRVVGAVDLDQRKLRRVVAKARFRALRLARIEAARLDERLVGPGGGTYKDLVQISESSEGATIGDER
jgi:hypothetical protein